MVYKISCHSCHETGQENDDSLKCLEIIMCNSSDTMSFFVQIMEGGVLSGLLVNEIGGIPGILAWPHGVSEKKKTILPHHCEEIS